MERVANRGDYNGDFKKTLRKGIEGYGPNTSSLGRLSYKAWSAWLSWAEGACTHAGQVPYEWSCLSAAVQFNERGMGDKRRQCLHVRVSNRQKMLPDLLNIFYFTSTLKEKMIND